MKEQMKKVFEGLSEDVQSKLKAASNPEEMMKVLEDADVKLDPEMLNAVAGGSCSISADTCSWDD